MHAAFATAADAIDAAVEAQIALTQEPWGGIDPLLVRMGLHTGAAEARDGDYYGTAVNRAARVMSVAHGQVIVSLATNELARDAPVGLIDLGEHRLRDLGEPEHVFQVAHRELARAFPRLRSVEAYPTNLPLQTTSFARRDEDIAEALDDVRVVTLTDVGGVGKTRLAIQTAAVGYARTRARHFDNPVSASTNARLTAELRTVLGDERFQQLRADGAAMDFVDAVALARFELDRMIDGGGET